MHPLFADAALVAAEPSSIANVLLPWLVLGLLLVLMVGLSALAVVGYGWLKTRAGTSGLGYLTVLVGEHLVTAFRELRTVALAEAEKITADGRVTAEEVGDFKKKLRDQALDTLPRHGKALGRALLGAAFPSWVGQRVDELFGLNPAVTVEALTVGASPKTAETEAAMKSALERITSSSVKANPSMPLGVK